MKKQNLKSLKLNKKIISNDYSLKGGIRDITDPSKDPDADCSPAAPADDPVLTTPADGNPGPRRPR